MAVVNINKVIETVNLTNFTSVILFWCTFLIVLDGYDLAVYGAVLPVLIR